MPLSIGEILEFLQIMDRGNKERREKIKHEEEARIQAKAFVELSPSECLMQFRSSIRDHLHNFHYPTEDELAKGIKENERDYSLLISELSPGNLASELEEAILTCIALHEKRGFFEGVYASEVYLRSMLLEKRKPE